MSQNGITNILIVGNQSLSRAIINAFIRSSHDHRHAAYKLSVLTYPSQSPYLPPGIAPNLVAHKTSDLSAPSLRSTLAGQDLVICTMRGGDYNFQVRLIDAALNAGVKRFIPHEFGHDSQNKGVQERSQPVTERAKVIKYLHRISVSDNSQARFEWVAASVGCILDSKLTSGDLGFDLQWESATIHDSGHERFPASSLERVARVVTSIVEHWDKVKNQFLYAAGILTSANEILACLVKSTGTRWSVGHSDVDECVRESRARIERGFPDAGMFLMERSLLYDEQLHAADSFQNSHVNELLQMEPEIVELIVDKAFHDFKHHGKADCGCD